MLPSSLLLTAVLALRGTPDTIPLFASDEPVDVSFHCAAWGFENSIATPSTDVQVKQKIL